jgi:UDP-N-acetylmuramoyl-tripeptide--D-alanyl-D-alanine ligase
MKFPLAQAQSAMAARPAGSSALPATLLVQTDTRTLEPGATFLALRGERFDGHAYLAEAFARGAACAIVDDVANLPAEAPALVVDDTLRAYLALGALARSDVRGPVVAISGSAGKTTTKQFLAELLAAAGVACAATPENENNEIGVAKFLCGLDAGDQRAAIVEMGARKYRDLDVLLDAAQPDIGVLTNIGEAHLEIMGSRERLAETKWSLPQRSRRAVLNLADAESIARAPSLATPPLWCGIDAERPPAGAQAVIVERDAVWWIDADGTTTTHHLTLRFPGDHNRRNLAAAFAAALLCGASADALAAAASSVALPHGRYEVLALRDGVRLVFDAYNASLTGTLATLATFGHEEAVRRIAVLGGMAELGDDAPAMHEKVGEIAAKRAHVVLAGGRFASDTARGVEGEGGVVVLYGSNDDATGWLRANVKPGDAILLKGSRTYKMEEIARGLGAEGFA